MTIVRRTFIAALGAAPVLPLLAQRAFAAFPERPIHLIVPFAAGGNADIVGRITGDLIVHANLGYDPLKDFVAIALTSYVPHALILSNKVQAKTMTDLIAASKTNPVTVATSGIGSATHMTLERLKAATGANLTHVPYRGGGALMPDLISGNVDGAMTEFSTALPMHQGGQA